MLKVGFLGAGRMASAMVEGILRDQSFASSEIICYSAPDGSGEALAERTGIAFTEELHRVCGEPDTVVLAFKPQQLSEMTPDHARFTKGKLIISIIAGSTSDRLLGNFPEARNIVRSMPNTPGQIGAGITCFASRNRLAATDEEVVWKILRSMGTVIPLEEEYLDAVTAVSGSGPAYLFEFVAALRDGGIAAGLDPGVAARLALETTLGAARLLVGSGETPETLKEWVSSPGGTTLAGLAVMDSAGFRRIMRETVAAAKSRSRELAGS